MKKFILLITLILSVFILSGCNKEDDKVKIYFFRGYNCSHCESSIEYINNHKSDIPKEIEIITYEVWKNPNNEKLHAALVDKLNVEDKYKESVPFLVISDEYQIGLDGNLSDFTELINKAKKYINNPDYKDIVAPTMTELQKKEGIKFQSSTLYKDSTVATYIVLSIFGVAVLGFIALIVFSRKN